MKTPERILRQTPRRFGAAGCCRHDSCIIFNESCIKKQNQQRHEPSCRFSHAHTHKGGGGHNLGALAKYCTCFSFYPEGIFSSDGKLSQSEEIGSRERERERVQRKRIETNREIVNNVIFM